MQNTIPISFIDTIELQILTKQYPVREILEKTYPCFKYAEVDEIALYKITIGFFDGSATRSVLADTVMGGLMRYAVQNKRWVGYSFGLDIKDLSDFLERKANRDLRYDEEGYGRAMDLGYISFLPEDNIVYVLPTENLINFAVLKDRQYASPDCMSKQIGQKRNIDKKAWKQYMQEGLTVLLNK